MLKYSDTLEIFNSKTCPRISEKKKNLFNWPASHIFPTKKFNTDLGFVVEENY